MNHIKINNSDIACPILKCSISGQEINDASLANAEWAEEVDEKGVSRPAGVPIAVLKEFRVPQVVKGCLNPYNASNIRIRWMPLDAFLIHQLRNSGVDYEKASRAADRLQNLWLSFKENFIWDSIGRGCSGSWFFRPPPPSVWNWIVRNRIKFTPMWLFSPIYADLDIINYSQYFLCPIKL